MFIGRGKRSDYVPAIAHDALARDYQKNTYELIEANHKLTQELRTAETLLEKERKTNGKLYATFLEIRELISQG